MSLINKKRGEISIVILVIGVFAICSLALLTFLVSDFQMGNNFVGVSVLEKLNGQIDEYKFYQNMGKEGEIDKYFDIIIEDDKKYFYIEKRYNEFLGEKNILLFSVRYPVPVKVSAPK